MQGNDYFRLPLREYMFEVMPFGLMNAPSTSQRMMDKIVRGLPFVRVHLDDVVVFSKTLEEHL